MYGKRVIAAVVSIFTLGVVFGIFFKESDTFSFRALFAVLAVFSVIVLAVSARPNGETASKRMSAAALAVAAFSLGVLRVSLYNSTSSANAAFDGNTDVAIFEIAEINENSVDAHIMSDNIGVPAGTLVRIYPDAMPQELLIGDSVECDVTYKYRNTNSLLSNGISLTASGSIISHNDGGGVFYTIRKSVFENSKILYKDFDYAADISRGVTIGDRTGLDSYIFSLYNSAGISHILAISGLHISIISMSLYNLLRFASANRKAVCIISSLFAVAYTAIVGFTAGAVRSAIMLVIIMLSQLFMRKADGFTSIFIALLVLLVTNPYSIYSASLQLSFLCSLGIMLVEPFMENINARFFMNARADSKVIRTLRRIGTAVFTPVIISFAASVFSFPVLFLSFDTVSYVSPIINIIAVPLFTYAVELSLLAFVVAPLSGILGMVFVYPAGFLFDTVTELSRFVYELDIGMMSVHLPMMILPFLLSVGIIASLIFLDNKRRVSVISCSVAFCLSIVACGVLHSFASNNNAVVEYGNSTGEYVYISYNGESVYVDMNGYTSHPEAIYENGNTALDKYVMLAYNTYSLERFKTMSGDLRVSTLYLPLPKSAADIYFETEIKELANSRNCDIIYSEDIYDGTVSEDISVQVFGGKENIAYETTVCVFFGDKQIQFLGNGFQYSVNSDVAVVTNGYAGDYYDIIADSIYAQNSYINKSNKDDRITSSFNERLRIEIDISESEYTIYEP